MSNREWGDLMKEVANISIGKVRLEEMIRFFEGQTKLKRLVFKAELYWITFIDKEVKNKFIINSAKKTVTFK